MSNEKCSVLYVDHLTGYFMGPGVANSQKLRWQKEMFFILMRNGFERIYLPTFSENDYPDFLEELESIRRQVPDIEENVIPVKMKKEWATIGKLLKPFREAINFDVERDGEVMRLELSGNLGAFEPYFDNRLQNFLTFSLIANKLKAHIADSISFGPKAATNDLESLRHSLAKRGFMGTDYQYILEQIEGLIRRYVDGTMVKFSARRPLTESEIRRILRLPEYKSASRVLRQVGLLGQSLPQLREANSLLKKIAGSRVTGNLLKVGKAAVGVFSPSASSAIRILEPLFSSVRTGDKPEFVPLFLEIEEFEKENRIVMTD